MKQTLSIIMIFACAFLMVACANEPNEVDNTNNVPSAPEVPTEPVAPEPSAPEPDQEMDQNDDVVPAQGDAKVIDSKTDVFGDGEMQDVGSKIEGVSCDPEERKITFTIENTGLYTWQLDNQVSFPPPADLKGIKVFINGYQANKKTPQYHPDTKELMFGPEELFSDNCGGVSELEVGDSVQCTLMPVKLNRGTGSNDLKAVNQIWIDSPNVDKHLEFTC